MMDPQAEHTVIASDGLFDFIIEVFATRRFAPDVDYGNAGSMKSVLSELVDEGVTLSLAFLSERFVLEARRGLIDDLREIPYLVNAEYVLGIMEAEENVARHPT